MLHFGLLGHPVAHSLSPVMHAASFRALGLEADYRCFDVPPERLSEQILRCRDEGFLGLNVTVPHKRAAVGQMDHLDISARRLGAVNTIRFDPDGTMTGFNTDASGFLADLRAAFGLMPMGQQILVVGCGGAGRAIAIACALGGCDRLALANRTAAKAEALAREIAALSTPAGERTEALPADPDAWVAAARTADLVVQCTPSGLAEGDEPVLPAEAFRRGQFLYDLVYTHPETPTMRAARAGGAWAVNGLGMLVHQGAASFRIWTGREANLSAMRMAVEGA